MRKVLLLTAVFAGVSLASPPAMHSNTYEAIKRKTDQVFYDYYKSENKPMFRGKENLMHLPTKHISDQKKKANFDMFGEYTDKNGDGKVDFSDMDTTILKEQNTQATVKLGGEKVGVTTELELAPAPVENREGEAVAGGGHGRGQLTLDDALSFLDEDLELSYKGKAIIELIQANAVSYLASLKSFFVGLAENSNYYAYAKKYKEYEEQEIQKRQEIAQLQQSLSNALNSLDACLQEQEKAAQEGKQSTVDCSGISAQIDSIRQSLLEAQAELEVILELKEEKYEQAQAEISALVAQKEKTLIVLETLKGVYPPEKIDTAKSLFTSIVGKLQAVQYNTPDEFVGEMQSFFRLIGLEDSHTAQAG